MKNVIMMQTVGKGKPSRLVDIRSHMDSFINTMTTYFLRMWTVFLRREKVKYFPSMYIECSLLVEPPMYYSLCVLLTSLACYSSNGPAQAAWGESGCSLAYGPSPARRPSTRAREPLTRQLCKVVINPFHRRPRTCFSFSLALFVSPNCVPLSNASC